MKVNASISAFRSIAYANAWIERAATFLGISYSELEGLRKRAKQNVKAMNGETMKMYRSLFRQAYITTYELYYALNKAFVGDKEE